MKLNKNSNKLLAGLLSLSMVFAVTSGSIMNVKADDITWSSESAITDYAYSFVCVGDTQKVSINCPEYLDTLYDWILDNQESKKIGHVFGLGDITDDNAPSEWTAARDAIYQMNGKISYSLLRGNHDGSLRFNTTFNHDVYTDQFNGFYDEYKIETSYKTMTIGNVNYLLITLDYGATDAELDWASRIIKAHPNRKVIVNTHGYMDSDGSLLNDAEDTLAPGPEYDMDHDYNKEYNDGLEIWDKLIKNHANIDIVLSGHMGNDLQIRTDTGVNGNTVTSFMINSQDLDQEYYELDGTPCGMVGILYFSEAGEYIGMEYYSTVRNLYYNENRDLVEKA